MKRIYATLMNRVDQEKDLPEDVGEVVVVDWDEKKVIKRILADSLREVKVGRSRGASGITWHENKIYVACREGILSFDPNSYELVDRLVFNPPGGYHQIKSHKDILWLACTGGDVKKGIKNNREIKHVRLSDVEHDTLHFNSLGWDPKGNEYHVYMGQKRLYNFTKKQDVFTNLGPHAHDVCFINKNELLLTQSLSGRLTRIDMKTRQQQVVFSKPVTRLPGGGSDYRALGFMRGVAFDPASNKVFVGVAPGSICEVDPTTWKERASVEICDIPRTCVYDLLLDPRDWGKDENSS